MTPKDSVNISDFDYPLPDERIARFPADERDASRLLVYRRGALSETRFRGIGGELPEGAVLVFNNTKVIRARIVMHKPSGARVEVFCLEPHAPADYERAFAAQGECRWQCIVGNLKKWKEGPLAIDFDCNGVPCRVQAWREGTAGTSQVVRFTWDAALSFGQLLEHLGRIPIPPYLGRDSEEIDNTRYQTVYSRFEGSVAAPTAGLHFTPELIERLRREGVRTEEVTLHVGAGTFLPVKTDNPLQHTMHTEHFEVTAASPQRRQAGTLSPWAPPRYGRWNRSPYWDGGYSARATRIPTPPWDSGKPTTYRPKPTVRSCSAHSPRTWRPPAPKSCRPPRRL